MATLDATLQIQNKERIAIQDDWTRVKILVEGDKSKYLSPDFFLPLPNEKYVSRISRGAHFKKGFINPTQSLIHTKSDFISKKGVNRESKIDALIKFMAKADQYGQTLGEFMKSQASPNLAAYGTVFAVVDKPRQVFDNKEQELKSGLPYLTILDPLDVVNWSWAKDGSLQWFRYKAPPVVDDTNPFEIPVAVEKDFITWTKNKYFRHTASGEQKDSIDHNWGIVPVAIQASFIIDSNRTLGRSSFFDSSDYLIMGNTNLSIANQEIFKYGSALLLMSQMDLGDGNIVKDRDPNTNLRKLAHETMEASDVMPIQDLQNAPRYLTKDIQIIDKAKAQAEFYFDLAVENEKSAKSVQNADKAQSGIAKGFDFADLDAVLATHAGHCEDLEKKILSIVSIIMKANQDFTVQYPRTFDTKGFAEKIAEIKELIAAKFPSKKGMAEAYKSLTPEISTNEETQSEINQEIEKNLEAMDIGAETVSTSVPVTSGSIE